MLRRQYFGRQDYEKITHAALDKVAILMTFNG